MDYLIISNFIISKKWNYTHTEIVGQKDKVVE
jgi:hypothetical protein